MLKVPVLPDNVEKGRYNLYVSNMYIIVPSKALYMHASTGHKAHILIPKPHIS